MSQKIKLILQKNVALTLILMRATPKFKHRTHEKNFFKKPSSWKLTLVNSLIKKFRGTWVAQSAKQLPSAQVMYPALSLPRYWITHTEGTTKLYHIIYQIRRDKTLNPGPTRVFWKNGTFMFIIYVASQQ